MRQAGRSLPEYRAIRERHAFFEINRSAELTAEVTLQPVRRHGVDAAVMFADIMTPVVAMGVDVELVEGVGPVVARAGPDARRGRAAARARPGGDARADPRGDRHRARASSRPSRRSSASAAGRSPSPATSSRASRRATSRSTKALMYARARGLARAARASSPTRSRRTRVAQARAGADVVQLFDSWVGALSPADYDEFVAPWSARVLGALRTRACRRSTSAPARRRCSPAMAAAGGDVIGLDWRIPLDEGWARVGRRARRPGQPRPGGAARAVGARRGGGARRPRARAAAARATSSTSATASSRAPTPTCSAACASSSTRRLVRWRTSTHAPAAPAWKTSRGDTSDSRWRCMAR